MVHPTPTKTLLTTTFEPLVMQLSGTLARGARLIERFVQHEPTPERTLDFERELSHLLREVGRRIMAWTLNQLEPQADAVAPCRIEVAGRLYRRRRRSPVTVATLFGSITLWRRLYEPLRGRGRSIHPLALRLGIEAGLAPPALAERVGYWATDHAQAEVMAMLQTDHGVKWSCTSLRKVLRSLQSGMAPHRESAQAEQLLKWLEQGTSNGRVRPTLPVGRDGIFVPLRHGMWQEGSVGTIAVLDRRDKRVGTAYLGRMPESGQGTMSTQLSGLLNAILREVDSERLRLAYVRDEGYHPSTYYHEVLKKMVDPRRPWRPLEWTRIVDFYHASEYVQKLADTIFGMGAEAQAWARQMRHVLKSKPDGITRVLQSASALERHRELRGEAMTFHKAYRYLQTRTQWMHYHLYKRQKLPLGSGITEAGCKIVFRQRLKRSGMSWTIEGGQTILDLRVIKLSQVWNTVYQR